MTSQPPSKSTPSDTQSGSTTATPTALTSPVPPNRMILLPRSITNPLLPQSPLRRSDTDLPRKKYGDSSTSWTDSMIAEWMKSGWTSSAKTAIISIKRCNSSRARPERAETSFRLSALKTLSSTASKSSSKLPTTILRRDTTQRTM